MPASHADCGHSGTQAETGSSDVGEVDFSTELAGTRVQTALRKAISFKRANDPPRWSCSCCCVLCARHGSQG